MKKLNRLRRSSGRSRHKNAVRVRQALKHNGLAHRLYQRAKNRKNVESTLTKEWIRVRLVAGVCEATNIPFSFTAEPWDPFQPSLDRKDSAKGYTPDNVQVVVLIHNMARNKWGDAALIKYVKALVKKARNNK